MSKKISWKIIISSFVTVFLLILLLIPWKSIIQSSAIEQINKHGFGPTQLEISSLGPTGIAVKNVSVLGDGMKINQLEVDWTLTGLIQKKISDIRVSGISFNPKSFPKTETSTEKEKDTLDFEEVLSKIPTENLTLELQTPENFKGYSFSKSPVVIKFEKSKRTLEISFQQGMSIKNEELDLSLKAFKLETLISKSKIEIFPRGLRGDFVYSLDKKQKSFVRLDELVLSDKSFFELTSGSEGVVPSLISLSLSQSRGSFGETNVNWGQIDLSAQGGLNNLKVKGSVQNINHVGSNCLHGLDLNFSANKSEIINFAITTPKSKKDFLLDIAGTVGKKVNFSFKSNLANVDFKKSIPCIGKDISEVKGDLSIKGYLNLGKKKNERLDLALKGAAFNWEEMKVKGIDIDSNVVNFSTFEGSTPSVIKIKKVGLAFDLNNISLKYLVNRDKIKVESFDLNILEGKLWSEPFALIRESNTTENLVVKVDNLPLNDVLKIGLKDAVEATGKLQGSLPINWVEKSPVVKGGLLETKDTGVLRYNPKTINPLEKTGNLNVNMLSDYLKDFRYSKLGIDVDSDEKYNLQMKAKILGVNPAVNNGRPLKFGFNLGLDIKNAIISYLALMKIPKKMEQNFLKKLQK